MQIGPPAGYQQAVAQCRHMDRGARTFRFVPYGKHTAEISGGRYDQREHVGEIEREPPAGRPERKIEARKARDHQGIEEGVDEIHFFARPFRTPPSVPYAAQADVHAHAVRRVVLSEKLEVAGKKIAHLARHRTVVPVVGGVGVFGQKMRRDLAQGRADQLALRLLRHAAIAVAHGERPLQLVAAEHAVRVIDDVPQFRRHAASPFMRSLDPE